MQVSINNRKSHTKIGRAVLSAVAELNRQTEKQREKRRNDLIAFTTEIMMMYVRITTDSARGCQ